MTGTTTTSFTDVKIDASYAQHRGIELETIQNVDLKNAAGISTWARESAMTLGNSGAFEVWGIQEDFQPQAPVTMEEAAVLMTWLLEQK